MQVSLAKIFIMEIILGNYSAGPFVIEEDRVKDIKDKSKVQIGMSARLKYSSASDVCGIQFDFILNNNEELVIKTGFLFGMEIKNLKEFISDNNTREKNLKHVTEIIEFIWPFTVGAFAARCGDHSFQMMLPPIDASRFASEVILSNQDKQ